MNKLKQKILDLCDKEGKQKQTTIWLITIASMLGMFVLAAILFILFIFVIILYPMIGIGMLALFFLVIMAIDIKQHIEEQINKDLKEKKKS